VKAYEYLRWCHNSLAELIREFKRLDIQEEPISINVYRYSETLNRDVFIPVFCHPEDKEKRLEDFKYNSLIHTSPKP